MTILHCHAWFVNAWLQQTSTQDWHAKSSDSMKSGWCRTQHQNMNVGYSSEGRTIYHGSWYLLQSRLQWLAVSPWWRKVRYAAKYGTRLMQITVHTNGKRPGALKNCVQVAVKHWLEDALIFVLFRQMLCKAADGVLTLSNTTVCSYWMVRLLESNFQSSTHGNNGRKQHDNNITAAALSDNHVWLRIPHGVIASSPYRRTIRSSQSLCLYFTPFI